MKNRLYRVYHIRPLGETDTSKFYVGITKNSLSFRLSQHMTSQRPIGTILRDLGRESVEIISLFFGSREAALQLEYELRPDMNIGWNLMAGGNCSKDVKVKLKSPDGILYAPYSLTQFCNEHGLVTANVRKVINGERRHTKGWTIER
jgi:predicted GIY-YIG superfamily endonuclease